MRPSSKVMLREPTADDHNFVKVKEVPAKIKSDPKLQHNRIKSDRIYEINKYVPKLLEEAIKNYESAHQPSF
jgi:hypothetical protein